MCKHKQGLNTSCICVLAKARWRPSTIHAMEWLGKAEGEGTCEHAGWYGEASGTRRKRSRH